MEDKNLKNLLNKWGDDVKFGYDIDIDDEMEDEIEVSEKQLNIEAIMALPKERREIVMRFILGSGIDLKDEIMVMIETMGLIIDKREGVINQILND